MLRITLAQLNLTVGDIEGNVQRMTDAARQAAQAGADLVVFTELALCGYYPGDMLEESGFMERVDAGIAALQDASRATPGLHWVVGTPTRAQGPGKRLHNSLLVLRDGAIRLTYAKQLLPTYNIFDERRHFEPGPDVARVLRIGHAQIGFLVCEDGWNDAVADYATNPFQRLADAAPDLVVSINASPSHIGKREVRHQVFGDAARRHGLPVVYVNQVGGQDQIVYDGASFAAEPGGGRGLRGAAVRRRRAHPVPGGAGASAPRMAAPCRPCRGRACPPWTSTASRSCSACATTRGAAASGRWWSAVRAVSTAP